MFHGMEPQLDSDGNENGDLISFPPEGRTLEIEIPDGSPSFGALISFIQQVIDSQRNSFSFLQVSIDNINGFITFRFKTLAECIAGIHHIILVNGKQHFHLTQPPAKALYAYFKFIFSTILV